MKTAGRQAPVHVDPQRGLAAAAQSGGEQR